MTPLRIQLRRTKGWRKPANTVVCSRPGRWGNPFVLGPTPARRHTLVKLVQRFEDNLLAGMIAINVDDVRRELAGHHLACWCGLCHKHQAGKPLDVDCPDCAPCHVDVLGRIANEETNPWHPLRKRLEPQISASEK